MYKIYCLINRENDNIIYIGRTKKSLGSRRSGHLLWLRSQGFNTDKIGIKLIENTDDKSREIF